MKLNLVQISVLVAALGISAALASGQSTDPEVPPKAKPTPQASGTDSKKTDSKKTDANGKNSNNKTSVAPKTGVKGQSGGIKVVPQTAPATGKSTAAKPETPATGSKTTAQPASGKPATAVTGSSPAAKKPTGTPAVQGSKPAGSKPAASGPATTHPGAGQNKQAVPVLTVKPSSKQVPVQQVPAKQVPVQKSATTSPTRKSAGTESPFAHKTSQPKIVQKKQATTNVVAASQSSSKISAAGRRDPFVSPIRTATVATTTPVGPVSCATGKRCLAVAELTVQGTAKDTDGRMMAIIARGANHPAYFLRENDQIFNGNVVKITCDSVIFREYATDANGRQNTHEVVKNVFQNSEAHKCRSSQ